MDAVSIPASSTPPLSYSIEQASRVAGVTPWTVYTAVTEGRLAARKFGKRWVILRDDLLAFLQNLNPVSPSTKWLEKRKKVATV